MYFKVVSVYVVDGKLEISVKSINGNLRQPAADCTQQHNEGIDVSLHWKHHGSQPDVFRYRGHVQL